MVGITTIAQIPIRAEKSHSSEMISQLLFGETYEVLEYSNNWMYIKTSSDNYMGWIDEKQFVENQNEQEKINIVSMKMATVDDNNNKIIISGGSLLPAIHNKSFVINRKRYIIDDSCIEQKNHTDIIEVAKQFIGSPYLWGGKTFMGFDCSGFVQTTHRICGISLPRDASQQVAVGTALSLIQEVKGGELAFFGSEDSITHVGILIDSETIIHCSGHVRIDRIDNTGIFDGDKYTHQLRAIKVINKL